MKVKDLFEIETLSQPLISNNGRWVAYNYRKAVLEENRHDNTIFYVSTDGGKPKCVMPDNKMAFAPKWVQHTELLSFISLDDKGMSQVFTLDPETSETKQVTRMEQTIVGYSWAPQSDDLALVLKDIKPVDKWWEGIRQPWVIDRQQFKEDGAGYLDRTRTHVYILNLQNGSLRQVTGGDYNDNFVSWSPDGQFLMFQSNRTRNPDGNNCEDIWIVAVSEGKPELQKISISDDMDMMPFFSPDGRYIAYTTYEEPDYFYFSLRKTALYDCKTKESRLIPAGHDRSVHQPAFSPDSAWLYYLYEDQGACNLARTSLATNEHEMVTSDKHYVFGYSIANDVRIALQISTYNTPGGYDASGNIYLMDKERLQQLTHHNEKYFADIELIRPEEIWYESSDGVRIQGWLFKPHGFDETKSYPLIFDIHGGPIMQFGYGFEDMAQFLAGNGYMVFQPNIRGSSGYGRDHQLGVWHDFGGQEMEDVVQAVNYLVKRPYIDSKRLAIQGWSHGGGVTNHAITKYPDLFAAAISGAGISSQLVEYGHDMYQSMMEKMYGLPWENSDIWQGSEPFDLVKHAKTPTMFVTGELFLVSFVEYIRLTPDCLANISKAVPLSFSGIKKLIKLFWAYPVEAKKAIIKPIDTPSCKKMVLNCLL